MSNISMNNNAAWTVTMDSLRNLFDTDKAGNFKTSVSATRGHISFDSEGNLRSTNRKWYQHQATSTEHFDTIALRRAIISMFQNEGGMKMDSDFMKKACEKLGFKNGGVELLPDANGSKNGSIAWKPLERRVVKQLLMDFDAAKKMQADIASFEIPDKAEIATIRKEERLERLSGLPKDEIRKEEFSYQVATGLMKNWKIYAKQCDELKANPPLANADQVEVNRYSDNLRSAKSNRDKIAKFCGLKAGEKPTFEALLSTVRKRVDEKMADTENANSIHFAKLFNSHFTPESKKLLEETLMEAAISGFKTQTDKKVMASGNKNHGIAKDFIRCGERYVAHSTINKEPLKNEGIDWDAKDVNEKKQLEEEFGSYDNPEPFAVMNAKKKGHKHGIYDTIASSAAHQILSHLPDHGKDYKNVMMFLTSQLSITGVTMAPSSPEFMDRDFGFGTLENALLSEAQRTGNVNAYHLEINDKEIVLKMDIGLGLDLNGFDKISVGKTFDFGTASIEMHIPLKDNSDTEMKKKGVEFGAVPENITMKTTITSLEEEVSDFEKSQPKKAENGSNANANVDLDNDIRNSNVDPHQGISGYGFGGDADESFLI